MRRKLKNKTTWTIIKTMTLLQIIKHSKSKSKPHFISFRITASQLTYKSGTSSYVKQLEIRLDAEIERRNRLEQELVELRRMNL